MRSLYALLLFVACIGIILASSTQSEKTTGDVSAAQDVLHRSYFTDADFFTRAYQGNTPQTPQGIVRAGIVPHHLLASHLIAEFFQGIEGKDIQTIVVIGPDHEHRSEYQATVSEGEWWTPFGILEPDLETITSLISSGAVSVDEKVFSIEHSITAQVAFIKKSFPDAKIVPIILKSTVSDREAHVLASALHATLPDNSLVLASVDFAHDVSHKQALERNHINVSILESMDVGKVRDMYLDSTPSITTVLSFAREAGARSPQLLHQSDTFEVINDYSVPSGTSYITMYFVK